MREENNSKGKDKIIIDDHDEIETDLIKIDRNEDTYEGNSKCLYDLIEINFVKLILELHQPMHLMHVRMGTDMHS